MIAELGHYLLILALFTALAQGIFPLIGAQKNMPSMMMFGDRAAQILLLLTALSFAALTATFIASDFSVKLAASHSHSMKPFIYKISGVWGNHEGSILLWTLMLAFYAALIPVFGKHLPQSLKARAIGVQGLLTFGFLAFILFTSNPFERLNPVPPDGQGLNPLLQDPGLAIHPPMLYMGYVGFSVAFSFSVAALIEGKVDAIWAQWLRPWVLAAWSFLTLGIMLGSVWAYYELGWGGWWMWDPVENVSFLPWLAGTALLHSIMVLGTRHKLANWTVLLGISTFSLSLIGTFVVRSGVLVSVHSFATDPERGVFILMLLMIATGSALGFYALRAKTLKGPGGFDPISREGGLIMNNLLLATATATVFIGTFYPLFMDAMTGDKISVGKPYFDLTFAPIMLLLILFMGAAPLLKWKSDSLNKLKRLALISLPVAILITVAATVFGKSVLGGIGLAISLYLAIGTVIALARKTQNFKNWDAQPAGTYGFVLAHLGVAIFTAGAVIMSVWAKDDIGRLKIGEALNVAGYSYTLKSVAPGARENYQFLAAEIDVRKNGRDIKTLNTEQRFYPVRNMVTTEAGFHFTLGPTVFAAISEGNEQEGWVIRANYHPYVTWIWIGALLMSLAGFISLFDRRLRTREPAS
jgi:cytochrome c-type biogenesis protein CcmF